DLLGLLAEDGTVTLEDMPLGEYRATFVPDPALVSVGLLQQRTLSVTATDIAETHTVTSVSPAEGDFLDAATAGADAELVVSKVTFNGVEHEVPAGGTTISGAYGELTIHPSG